MIVNGFEIIPEDIPEEYSDIMDAIGIESTVELIKLRGGEQIYFQKLDQILKPARDRKIIQEFNGINLRKLGRRYNLTENHVREIIKANKIKEFNKSVSEKRMF